MISDDDIRQVTEAFVTIANKSGLVDRIISDCAGHSLAFKIIGSRIKTGFIIYNGKIKMLSELDRPEVTVTIGKDKYWDIINSDDVGTAKAKFYLGIFTEESIAFDPPPGVSGGALKMENVISVLSTVTECVLGGEK